jgi:hypothetical protein
MVEATYSLQQTAIRATVALRLGGSSPGGSRSLRSISGTGPGPD